MWSLRQHHWISSKFSRSLENPPKNRTPHSQWCGLKKKHTNSLTKAAWLQRPEPPATFVKGWFKSFFRKCYLHGFPLPGDTPCFQPQARLPPNPMIQSLAGAGRGMRHWIHVAGLNGTSQSFVFCRNCVEIFKASSTLNWPQLMDSQDLLPSPSWHLMVRQKSSDISATLCRCHVNNLKLKPSGENWNMHHAPDCNQEHVWWLRGTAKGRIWARA